MTTSIATPTNQMVIPPPLREVTEYLDETDEYIPGEIQVDEQGRLYKKYLRYEGFLDFLSRGFDTWVIKIIPRQLRSRQLRIPGSEAVAFFDNPLLEPPMLSVSGQTTQILWPKVARDRQLDYSGALYADLVVVENGQETSRVEKVFLGMIPVMLGSEFDHLRGLDSVELLAKGECPADPLRYFIVKGNEKVVLLHEKMSAMKNLVYLDRNHQTKRVEEVSKITNESFKGSNVVAIVRMKSNALHLRFSFLGKDRSVNLFTVFKLFGMDDPQEILMFMMTFTREAWAKRVLEKLNVTYLEFQEIGDPVVYISKIIPSRREEADRVPLKDQPYLQQKQEILRVFREELFPQIPANPEEDYRRNAMLAQMAIRLVEYMAGFRKADNRDDWANKRLDPASESMKQLFQMSFQIVMDELQKEVTDKGITNPSSIAQKFKSSKITKIFHDSIASTNWGIKGVHQKNIVDPLKNFNLLDAYSHLTRVRVTTKNRESQASRMVQPSACGFVCPAETPERGDCGIIKNLAITAMLTIYDPETDILIYEQVNPHLSKNKTDLNQSKCWFNGTFLGWCPGVSLKDHLIQARRNQEIPLQTSVVLDDDNILHVTTTSSRVSRPLLIVNPDGQLVLDEKELWGADFVTLINQQAVEYIDAFEQNYVHIAESLDSLREHQNLINQSLEALARAYAKRAVATGELDLPEELAGSFGEAEFAELIREIAEFTSVEAVDEEINSIRDSLTKLAKKGQFTHVELDPSAIWGFAGSMIPLANHNMGPRITYQCHMGKQAMGIYHSQQQYRFQTTIKRLVYPSRSFFETQMAKELGFDKLPAGQPVTIAVLMYGGWNQEDAFILNEAAVQRGLFRYVKEYNKHAIEKREENFEVIITRPEIKKNTPAERYANLDENGIVRVGSLVKPKDAIVGMVRRNISTGQVENASLFMGEHEYGRVEDVFITRTMEDRRIVYVKIVDTRSPVKGSKFSLRPAQKGTVGLVMAEVDMPFTANGVIPDMIINPLAFPSRMTMGTILEIITSKAAALAGSRVNATSFRPFDLQQFTQLLKEMGYQSQGDEVLYSGITGQQMKSTVFTGISYVQRLKHDVEDKIQARAKGPIVPQTRQPTKGRAEGGGLKIGEMETWAFMTHGAANSLKQQLCDSSDATPIVFCGTCGTLAIANHVDEKYECRLCGDTGNFGRGTIPYAEKRKNDLLYGMNIGVRYRFRQPE